MSKIVRIATQTAMEHGMYICYVNYPFDSDKHPTSVSELHVAFISSHFCVLFI